eukprot:gb/GECH01003420.1/.p1 GENE.gb/GECH01003420.1/~~gb/GECH01003420.1/.p1  ORF type:complete len:698 (+),score=175.54 gb/GECH01003420.1/:1-2094(+)
MPNHKNNRFALLDGNETQSKTNHNQKQHNNMSMWDAPPTDSSDVSSSQSSNELTYTSDSWFDSSLNTTATDDESSKQDQLMRRGQEFGYTRKYIEDFIEKMKETGEFYSEDVNSLIKRMIRTNIKAPQDYNNDSTYTNQKVNGLSNDGIISAIEQISDAEELSALLNKWSADEEHVKRRAHQWSDWIYLMQFETNPRRYSHPSGEKTFKEAFLDSSALENAVKSVIVDPNLTHEGRRMLSTLFGHCLEGDRETHESILSKIIEVGETINREGTEENLINSMCLCVAQCKQKPETQTAWKKINELDSQIENWSNTLESEAERRTATTKSKTKAKTHTAEDLQWKTEILDHVASAHKNKVNYLLQLKETSQQPEQTLEALGHKLSEHYERDDEEAMEQHKIQRLQDEQQIKTELIQIENKQNKIRNEENELMNRIQELTQQLQKAHQELRDFYVNRMELDESKTHLYNKLYQNSNSSQHNNKNSQVVRRICEFVEWTKEKLNDFDYQRTITQKIEATQGSYLQSQIDFVEVQGLQMQYLLETQLPPKINELKNLDDSVQDASPEKRQQIINAFQSCIKSYSNDVYNVESMLESAQQINQDTEHFWSQPNPHFQLGNTLRQKLIMISNYQDIFFNLKSKAVQHIKNLSNLKFNNKLRGNSSSTNTHNTTTSENQSNNNSTSTGRESKKRNKKNKKKKKKT